MKQIIVVLVLSFIIVSFCVPCFAEEYKEETQKKISRGLANVLSAFGEIPKSIAEESEDTKLPVYEIIDGIFRGAGKTVVRFISGVYDLVVSPIPNIKTFPPDPETLGSTQK